MMPPYSLTELSVLAFVVIPAALIVLFAWGTAAAWRAAGEPATRIRRAVVFAIAGSLAWMAATWLVASRGVLLDWYRTPPPFAIFVVTIFALAGGIGCSRIGERLARYIPLWALVAVQGFRLPLELAMHRMGERGIMPEQMGYSGLNFDIVTGISALIVALLVRAGVGGRRLVLAWNVAGSLLLANILTIAILSTPRFAYFGPDRLNVWVMHPPFVWLPAVMVLAALAGHVVVFRAVLQQRVRPEAGAGGRASH